VEGVAFVQQPDTDGEREPDERGEDEGLRKVCARQPYPEDGREPGEADAAHGRATSVDSGDDASAIGAVEAGAGFVLLLMCFNEACAGGKDGREREKEAADGGPETL